MIESWRVDDRVDDRELEKFRLSLLGKTDLGKVDSGKVDSKGKVDNVKGKVDNTKENIYDSESKVDSGKVDKTKVNICAGERKETLVSKISLYIETFPQKIRTVDTRKT